MAKATKQITPLSTIIQDPRVRAAFRRAEREQGDDSAAAAVAAPRQPQPLAGGACRELVEA